MNAKGCWEEPWGELGCTGSEAEKTKNRHTCTGLYWELARANWEVLQWGKEH